MRAKTLVPKILGIAGTAASLLFLLYAGAEGIGLVEDLERVYTIEGTIGLIVRLALLTLGIGLAIFLVITLVGLIAKYFAWIVVCLALLGVLFMISKLTDTQVELRATQRQLEQTKEENTSLRLLVADLVGEKRIVGQAQDASPWARAYLASLVVSALLMFIGGIIARRSGEGAAFITAFFGLLATGALFLGGLFSVGAKAQMALVTATVGGLSDAEKVLLAAPTLPLIEAFAGQALEMILGGINCILLLIPLLSGLGGALAGGGNKY